MQQLTGVSRRRSQHPSERTPRHVWWSLQIKVSTTPCTGAWLTRERGCIHCSGMLHRNCLVCVGNPSIFNGRQGGRLRKCAAKLLVIGRAGARGIRTKGHDPSASCAWLPPSSGRRWQTFHPASFVAAPPGFFRRLPTQSCVRRPHDSTCVLPALWSYQPGSSPFPRLIDTRKPRHQEP